MSAVGAPVAAKPRRWWRWFTGVVVALPLLLVAVVLWLFLTASGRDVLLAQVQRLLPPEALTWRAAEGHLSGGLVLHEVRYRADGVSVELARVELDLSATALLTGAVHVRSLRLSDGRIDLPAAAPTPDAWPQRIELPRSLPGLVLPVAIRVDAIELQRLHLTRGEETLWVLHRLATVAELAEGRLHLRALVLDSDRVELALTARIDTTRAWASQVKATARLPIENAQALPLELELTGDLKDLRLVVRTDVGEPAELRMRARGGLPAPNWSLEVDAPRIEPERLGASGEPLVLSLRAEGDLAQATLEGRVRQGDLDGMILPSQLTYRDATLGLAPLALSSFGGEIELSGQVDGSGAEPMLSLDLLWRDLVLPATDASDAVRTHGQAHVEGSLDDYALELDGRFARAADAARLVLEGRGSLREMNLQTLRATLPGGSLQATGKLQWDPDILFALDAQLDEFDPSYFAPDLPGAIAARIALEGGVIDGEPYGTLHLDGLAGQLRGKALSGSAEVSSDRNGHGAGALQLGLGASRLAAQGRWSEQLAIDVRLEPVMLADLLPQASGELRGVIELRGTRKAPALGAQLDGQDITFKDQSIARLRLRAALDGAQRGSFSLEGKALVLGGQAFETLSLSGEGDRATHDLSLALDGTPGRFGLALSGGLDTTARAWQGQLAALQLERSGDAVWTLRNPAQLAFDFDTLTLALAHTCLDAAPAWGCVQVERKGDGMEGSFELADLNLALFDPLLTAALDQPTSLAGELAGSGQFERTPGGGLRAQAQLTIPSLSLMPDPGVSSDSFDLSNVQLSATLDSDSARLDVDARTQGNGHLRARVTNAAPFTADGALEGDLDLLLSDLTVLGLFSDQVVAPSGRIEGRLVLAGTRAEPRLDGSVELTEFSAELPALGIAPSHGHLVVRSADARTLALAGELRLGEGIARFDGQFDPAAEGGPTGSLGITGENLTVMDIPEAKVTASPDLRLEIAGKTLKLRGSVDVPWARVDLERLESVVTPSADVVITDAAEPKTRLALDSDIQLSLGQDVRLSGFGLKGTLAGQLRVRDQPGRATTARGSIEVGGKYKAYGQDLTITRGHIAWAATPLSTPSLDVRAERKVDAITVGVQVRGMAAAPELSLWSRPVMEQAEQLSYLILGRPLRSASQAEGSQLSQAAAAMGGNLLAKNLGARLGLDEMEVADSRALGGAALTVGTYLSPRLHVSYGVALFGSGQVITFKYLLNHLWNIQLDSGTEDRVMLNYRLER